MNQNPLIQVLVRDQTRNNVGLALMNNLRDPAFPAGNQYNFITQSRLGPLAVNYGGWRTQRRLGIARFFVLLRIEPEKM